MNLGPSACKTRHLRTAASHKLRCVPVLFIGAPPDVASWCRTPVVLQGYFAYPRIIQSTVLLNFNESAMSISRLGATLPLSIFER